MLGSSLGSHRHVPRWVVLLSRGIFSSSGVLISYSSHNTCSNTPHTYSIHVSMPNTTRRTIEHVHRPYSQHTHVQFTQHIKHTPFGLSIFSSENTYHFWPSLHLFLSIPSRTHLKMCNIQIWVSIISTASPRAS